MKLIQIDEFALRPIDPLSSDEMPQSELMLNRQPSGRIIDGAVLEAAIRWHDLLLAFVTDNIMHEETLRIYLFDANWDVVDSAKLGWMYATGAFSLLELAPPDTVHFLFFDDTNWTLELFNIEAFVVPFLTDPRGVSRPFRFHRRFQIDAKPKPERPRSSERALAAASGAGAAQSRKTDMVRR